MATTTLAARSAPRPAPWITALAGQTAIAIDNSTLFDRLQRSNTELRLAYDITLEGWSRAGIKHVELTNGLLDDFLKTDSLPAARRVLTDLGLTPVSIGSGPSCASCPSALSRSKVTDALGKDIELYKTTPLGDFGQIPR